MITHNFSPEIFYTSSSLSFDFSALKGLMFAYTFNKLLLNAKLCSLKYEPRLEDPYFYETLVEGNKQIGN